MDTGQEGSLEQRKIRSPWGTSHRVPPGVTQMIEALALQTPPLSVAAMHRQVISLAAQGTPAPCYRTVYNIIRRIVPALLLPLASWHALVNTPTVTTTAQSLTKELTFVHRR